MYYTLNEFLQDWNFESEATLKILNCLTDESLSLKVDNKVRTPGRIAWHITLMIGKMLDGTGLILKDLKTDSDVPPSAQEIVNTYRKYSIELVNAINSQWTDESLKDEVLMFGETWTKEKILYSLVKHQIHHRGQLTILMRQAGLINPGIYGPSSEEWINLGMQPKN